MAGTLDPDKPLGTAQRTSIDPRSSVSGVLGREIAAQAENFSVSLNKRRVLEEGVELDRAKLRFKGFLSEVENGFDDAEDHLSLPKDTQETIDKQIERVAKGLPSSVRHDFGIYAGTQGLASFNKSRTASVKIGNDRFLGGLEERKELLNNLITSGAPDKTLQDELDSFKASIDSGKELGALSSEAGEKEKVSMIQIVQDARLERDFNNALKSDEGGVDKNGDGVIMMPVQHFKTILASEEYRGASVGAVQTVRDQILSAYIQQEEARDKAIDEEIADGQAVNKSVLLAGMPGSNIPGQEPTTLAKIYTLEAKGQIDPKDVPGLVEKYEAGLGTADKDLKDARDARFKAQYEEALNLINLADEEPEVYIAALKLNQEKYSAEDFAKLQDELDKRVEKRDKATKEGKGLMEANVTKARKAARVAMTPVWGDKSLFSNFSDAKELQNDARRNLGAAIAEEAVRKGKDPNLAVSNYIRESLLGDIKPDVLVTAIKVEKYITTGTGDKPTRRELSEHLLYLNMKNTWESQSGTGKTSNSTAGTTEDLTKTIKESQPGAFKKLMELMQGKK